LIKIVCKFFSRVQITCARLELYKEYVRQNRSEIWT